MTFEELQALIISLSQDYISIEEIATKVHKTPKYLINFSTIETIPRNSQPWKGAGAGMILHRNSVTQNVP